MRKILLGVLTIGAVAGVAFAATNAFFSDTETSTDNRFEAGAIDLQIDYNSTYNGDQSTSWQLKDLTESDRFFDLGDLKPGDEGEGTISLHVYNNNAWACVNIIPTLNDDNGSTEPELEVDDEDSDSIFDGELAQNMEFKIWADICEAGASHPEAIPGDNIYQPECDKLLTQGNGPITPTTWALADSEYNVFTGRSDDPILGSHNYYLGVGWSIPDSVGNIIQTDKYMADISFYAVQSRNNEGFRCSDVSIAPQAHYLKLENETPVEGGPWIIINDETYAELTWTGDGNTFDYNLTGQGLTPSTNYALIYYADGWPGNNPGAYIGGGASDTNGDIAFSGTPNLGIDLPSLPDGNYAIGAKIWLVLASDYNNGTAATGPMTAWQPDKYLFEGNVYIHYDDQDAP